MDIANLCLVRKPLTISRRSINPSNFILTDFIPSQLGDTSFFRNKMTVEPSECWRMEPVIVRNDGYEIRSHDNIKFKQLYPSINGKFKANHRIFGEYAAGASVTNYSNCILCTAKCFRRIQLNHPPTSLAKLDQTNEYCLQPH